MNNPAAYTPLESLFLFQALLTHGVEAAAFTSISELLKNNTLIKEEETYDAGRLAPDALRELFLHLLREELKSENEQTSKVDGASSPNSKKRKAPTPSLPTLKAVLQHVERLPILIDRLYARYRDHLIRQIREDEQRIEALQKEIHILEKAPVTSNAPVQKNGTPTAEPVRQSKLPNGPATSTLPTATVPAAVVTPVPVPIPIKANLSPIPPTQVTQVPTPPKPPPFMLPAVMPATQTPPPQVAKPVEQLKQNTNATQVLQPPVGVAQAGTAFPASNQVQPAVGQRSESTPKGKVATSSQVTPNQNTGTLKWEKPYQPGPQPQIKQPSVSALSNSVSSVPTPALQVPSGRAPPNLPQYTAQAAGQSPAPQTPQSRVQPSPVQQPVLVPPQPQAQPVAAPPVAVTKPPTGPQVVPTSQAKPSTGPIVRPPGVQPLPNQNSVPAQPPRSVTGSSTLVPPPVATTPVAPTPQRWQQQPPFPTASRPQYPPSPSPAPPTSIADGQRPYSSPYNNQPPQPAIPGHLAQRPVSTPSLVQRVSNPIPAPQTPVTTTPTFVLTGSGTKWTVKSTPSTPRPNVGEIPSPAYEPLSPVANPAVLPTPAPQPPSRKPTPKPVQKIDSVTKTTRGRPPRSTKGVSGPGGSSTSVTRRSQSVVSGADELSLDHHDLTPRVKDEDTPRPHDETGDTTADESVPSRRHMITPSSVSSRLARKRKRQGTPVELQQPPAPATHVLWTRSFPRVSSSALDQIGSHRHANMFANPIRDRDAPGYKSIVRQSQDIKSIRIAISQGHKYAQQAAGNLPDGDPGTGSVWLPISEELVPPKGIINSAQLERELVHMFSNAVMYNLDPDRGPGPAFMKRRSAEEGGEILGYEVDENGVVRDTRSMFLEVEKLLSDLRSAEKERTGPPPSTTGNTRPASVATGAGDDSAAQAEDDVDELAGDTEVSSTTKRKRIGTRG
jgi:hypothetical protein